MAWEAIVKLITALENLGFGDSMGPSQFHLFYDSKKVRGQCFPLYQFFSFSKFMYCLVFFILLVFQHFIVFRSILPEKGFSIF